MQSVFSDAQISIMYFSGCMVSSVRQRWAGRSTVLMWNVLTEESQCRSPWDCSSEVVCLVTTFNRLAIKTTSRHWSLQFWDEFTSFSGLPAGIKIRDFSSYSKNSNIMLLIHVRLGKLNPVNTKQQYNDYPTFSKRRWRLDNFE